MDMTRLTAQDLADNLGRNVKLDHIEDVETGLRPMDEDYVKFKKETGRYFTVKSKPSKNEQTDPLWAKALAYFGNFILAFFIGGISIWTIEGLGDWYQEKLKNPPLWQWYLYALITGAIVIGIWKLIEHDFEESETNNDR
jgi:hypothetical protein